MYFVVLAIVIILIFTVPDTVKYYVDYYRKDV